jgi:agmatinase
MSILKDTIGRPVDDLGTFLGLPRCDDLAQLEAAVCIIGAPIATSYPGFDSFSATAPSAIRSAMAYYAPVAHHYDFDIGGSLLDEDYGRIVDAGDLTCSETDFALNRANIESAVRRVLDAGARPIVLGGDDSIPIPVWQAFEGRGLFTVLQFDAHLDFRDQVAGERYGLSSNIRRASEMPWVERIIQVGMRSTGSARLQEVEDARRWGTTVIPARQVHERGVGVILEQLPTDLPVLVNVDIDCMDNGAMPAVMSPNPGGLGYWHIVDTLHAVADIAPIEGFNLTELMPSRDSNGTCAMTAARIVFNAAAMMARHHGT